MKIDRLMKFHALRRKAVENPTGLSKQEHEDFLLLENEFRGFDLIGVLYDEYVKAEASKIIALSALEFYSRASAFSYLMDRCRVAKRAIKEIWSLNV